MDYDGNYCEYCVRSYIWVRGLEYRLDPYMEEVAGMNVWKWLCDDCYLLLREEI